MDRKDNITADSETIKLINENHLYFSEDELISASNKGTYKRGLKDTENYSHISIEKESDAVIVMLDDTKAAIKAQLSDCTCSCPSKVLCRHIITSAIAVSGFCQSRPPKDTACAETESVQPDVTAQISEDDKAFLKEVMSTAGRILNKGFANCSENDAEILTRLSLRCPAKMKKISNMCRACAENISLMNNKNAGFVPFEAVMLVSRIYNTADAMAGPQGISLYSLRSNDSSSNSDFLCLGVYPRKSRSGYYGITAIFYSIDEQCFFTYNDTLPDFYNKKKDFSYMNELRSMLSKRKHWSNNMSAEQLSGRIFRLRSYKSDSDMRISSSSSTVCSIKGELSLSDIPECIRTIPQYKEYDYFSFNKTEDFYLIKDPAVSEVFFDNTLQVLNFAVSDKTGVSVHCSIPYTDINIALIDFIEKNHGCEFDNSFMLMRRYLKYDYPVSLIYDNRTENICF
ncbi:MAG: SWIM zinc finger family protein [Oscillospiraceae bacterium]|nr:SWIM zinc finger family protein [Oscillospiraceae bacterium]